MQYQAQNQQIQPYSTMNLSGQNPEMNSMQLVYDPQTGTSRQFVPGFFPRPYASGDVLEGQTPIFSPYGPTFYSPFGSAFFAQQISPYPQYAPYYQTPYYPAPYYPTQYYPQPVTPVFIPLPQYLVPYVPREVFFTQPFQRFPIRVPFAPFLIIVRRRDDGQVEMEQ